MDDTEREIGDALEVLRTALEDKLEDYNDVDLALCSVVTFCAVAMAVMKRTNPSKIRSEAMTVEIRARLDGVPVIRGA
jgi:hypothetical protein